MYTIPMHPGYNLTLRTDVLGNAREPSGEVRQSPLDRQAACNKGLSPECPAKPSVSLTPPIGGQGWSQRRGSYLPKCTLPSRHITPAELVEELKPNRKNSNTHLHSRYQQQYISNHNKIQPQGRDTRGERAAVCSGVKGSSSWSTDSSMVYQPQLDRLATDMHKA